MDFRDLQSKCFLLLLFFFLILQLCNSTAKKKKKPNKNRINIKNKARNVNSCNSPAWNIQWVLPELRTLSHNVMETAVCSSTKITGPLSDQHPMCKFSHCHAPLVFLSLTSMPFMPSSHSFQALLELIYLSFLFLPSLTVAVRAHKALGRKKTEMGRSSRSIKMMSGRKVPGYSCFSAVRAPGASLARGCQGSPLLHCLKTVSPAGESAAAATQLDQALYFCCLFRRLFIVLD